MLKKISIFLSVIVTMVVLLAIQAAAASTPWPVDTAIRITNNLTGTPDKVEIDNVELNNIIKVYSTEKVGTPVAVMVALVQNETFYINQVGTGEGTAYVTITKAGFGESERKAVAYLAERETKAPVFDEVSDISIQNRIGGLPDVITLSILTSGDIVRVYPNSVSTVTLGTVVSTGSSAVICVNQLGAAAGRVYISVQSTGELESKRTPYNYDSETTALLDPITVEVKNNFTGTDDTIMVPDVAENDTITVYKTLLGDEVWISKTLAAGDIVDEKVTLNVGQLGTKAGKVYVTKMTLGKAESKRAAVSYPAEPTANAPTVITVTNNYNSDDKVDVSGLVEGDIVKVYNSPESPVSIGSDTVGVEETVASAPVSKGLLSATGGKLYVTVTSAGKNESNRTTVAYGKEEANKALPASKIEVYNVCKGADSMKVSLLTAGDIISIYTTPTGGTAILSEKATSDSITFLLGTATLLAKGGNIYVTITTAELGESPRTAKNYQPEKVTAFTAAMAKSIIVTNNYNASDRVDVPGLKEYDTVRVYSTLTGATQIGSKSVAAGATSVTIDIDDNLLSAAGGKIYVSVESQTENESTRMLVTYTMEATATAPTNIAVTNNYKKDDTILISGLLEKYTVSIYSSPTGTAIKSGEVAVGETTIEFTLDADKVLLAAGGKIYVSVKYPLSNESPRTAFVYESEKSKALLAANVDVDNNYYIATDPTTKDSVKVSGVEVGDFITIYKASGGTATWAGPVEVLAAGTVDIPIDQLGTKAGSIYLAVTKLNKSESVRTSKPFDMEPVTAAPSLSSIIIENNFAADDIVTIDNLTKDQIINIYTTPTGAAILSPVTATGTSYKYVLDNGVLAANGGKLYMSVKDPTKLESIRTALTYTSETTVSPKTSNILVVNYPGNEYDTVTLVGLTAGDIVTIYKNSGELLSRATVAGKGTTLTLDTNLPDSGGTIYVTLTNEGKAESKRVTVAYQDA